METKPALNTLPDLHAEIEAKAAGFDLTKPQSDEEFDESLESLGQFLLFGTRFESMTIRNRKALRTLPILNDLPLLCQGRECPYAKTCSVIRDLTDPQVEDLKDKPCRDERHFALDIFSKLAKEMAIAPDNTVDLMTCASLVRYYLQQRRIMRRMQMDDLMVEEPAVVDQRSGNVYWRPVVHPLQPQLLLIEKQIEALLKQLVASRKDRLNAAAQLGRGQSMLEKLLDGSAWNSSRDNSIVAESRDVTDEEEEE